MKICILSDEHYPHTGADTIVVMNTASALGAAGARVELVVPKLWRKHKNADEVLEHYGVKPTFTLTRLASWPPPGRKMRLEKLVHGIAGPLYARKQRFDIIHSRDLLPLLMAQTMGLNWSFETYRRHAEEKPLLPKFTRRIGLKRSIGAVAHSKAAAEDLVKVGFDEDAVIVARPGFTKDRFLPKLSKKEARLGLGLDGKRPLVVYVGNVGPSKGTDEITDLATRLPNVDFLVVGGAEDAISQLRANLESKSLGNVTLVGHKPPGDVAPYMYAADVLFVPAIFHNAFSGSLAGLLRVRTLPGTPLKIYGYMASQRPIVSADQAHTRDLLRHEHTALMVPPQDGEATANAISRLLEDSELSQQLSMAAAKEADDYTFENRGKLMLAFFERRLAAAAARLTSE
ncbi:MAG: glycosyltransferase family 4 protein [Proteobacteria bacterium]|nr:glycosyltransferase family 4 protein [Pseudomonadota bacterium]